MPRQSTNQIFEVTDYAPVVYSLTFVSSLNFVLYGRPYSSVLVVFSHIYFC